MLTQNDQSPAALEAELVKKARGLIPLLKRNAQAGENQRSPTDEAVAALEEIGVWAVITPKRWGGLGLPSLSLHRINREIAKGDPAVAWVLQIINGCAWIASLTSDRLQEDIFGGSSKPPRVCSSFAVPCRADEVDGGFIVNGTWPYNSGSKQSSWGQYLVTAHFKDGRVTQGNFVYIPMSQVTINEDWQCVGIQGSSSDSSTVKDLFVPAHRFVAVEQTFGHREEGKRHVGEFCDNWNVIPLIRAAGVGLLVGAAEGALELALETAATRGIPGTIYTTQRNSSVVQRNLGEVSAKLAAARDLAETLCITQDELALSGRVQTPIERAHQKARVGMVVEMLTTAMEKIMYTAGSSAFNKSNGLQRYWRDINTGARHMIYLPEVGYEVLGRAVLGVEPNIIPPQVV